jgi:hypothetical protein
MILSEQIKCTESAAAVYTTHVRWLPTQGYCRCVFFSCLFMQMVRKTQAYAVDGNHEQGYVE